MNVFTPEKLFWGYNDQYVLCEEIVDQKHKVDYEKKKTPEFVFW